MSDDRDIDDILESLDQLLRSGGHHNDDHVDHTPPPLPSRKAKTEAKAADQAIAGKAAQQPSLTTGDPLFDLPLGEEFAPEDEPLPDAPAAPVVASPRVVLTEEMMVNNPQGKLGLRMVAESAEHSPQSEAAEAAQKPEAVDVDHEQLERLMVQVSDDVIARLQEELPRMIRTSLYRHLNELKQGGDDSASDTK